MENSFRNVGAAVAGAFAVGQLKDFAVKVATVRGEFQQLEIAFSTMLGSKKQADALMAQLIDTAATTPFGMNDLANSAKQLLAYGTAAEDVNETLIRLGDIAAGLSIPINDLAFLYGSTMVQGRLYTQDLNQFLNRGIPIIGELAKQFGVAEGEVKKLVEQGKVGFPEVQKAIISLTDEGSKFGGLMAAQSKSITGQISNIEDGIEQMFNDMGKSSEGAISSLLGVAGSVVDHWRQIGIVIAGVITTFGAYKAAVLAVSVAQKIANMIAQEAAYQQRLAALQGIALSEAQAVAAAKTNILTIAMNGLKAAILTNPIGLIVGVIGAAVTALTLFNSSVEDTTELSERFGKAAADSMAEVEFLSTALKGLDSSSVTYKKTLSELNTILEEYGLSKLKEGASIDEVNEKRAQAIALIKEEGVEQQRLNGIQTANDQYKKAQEEANKDLNERLGSATYEAFRDNEGHAHYRALSELQKNTEAVGLIISQAVQENGKLIAGKTGEELEKGRAQLKLLIKERMRDAGFSSEVTDNNWLEGWFFKTDILDAYIDKMQEATDQQQRFIDITNRNADAQKRAADAGLTMAQRVTAGQNRMLAASKTAADLYDNVRKIAQDFADNTLNFHIRFDAEVPAWMKNMKLTELRRLGSHFTSLATEMRKAGQTSTKVNGKTYSFEEVTQRGLDYSKAAAQREEADKKAEEDRKARAEQEKKDAESARKKAATEAKQRAESARKERERIQNETFDRNQTLKRYRESVAEEAAEGEREISQRKIDAMEEGFAKEMAVARNNALRMQDEVAKLEKDMLAKLADARTTEWLNANPRATKQQQTLHRNALTDEGSSSRLTRADLAPSQRAQLEERERINAQIAEQAQAQLLTSLRDRYQDFEAQRTAIAERYAKDRAALELAALNPEEKARLLTVMAEREKKERSEVYTQEADLAQKSSDFLVRLFEDTAEKTTAQLRTITEEGRALIDYLKNTASEEITPHFGFTTEQLRALKESPEKLRDITAQVKRLNEETLRANPFRALAQSVKELFDIFRNNDDSPDKLQPALKRLSASLSATLDLTAPLVKGLKDVFASAENDTLAGAMGGVEQVLSSVSNVAKGFTQGGIVVAGIAAAGELINVVAGAFQAQARHKKALAQVRKEELAQQRAYSLSLLDTQLQAKDTQTAFGTLEYKKTTAAVRTMHKAYDELREGMKSLSELEVKTGHKKTGLFGWGKGKDVFSGILSVFPQLINAQGEFDEKVAQTIVDSREMKEEHKQTLQHLIKLKETAEKAREEVRSYLQGIFGDLGTQLSDALVSAFRNGTDAAEQFTGSLEKMLEKMGEKMIFSAIFAEDFERASKQMEDIQTSITVSDDQKLDRMTAVLDQLNQQVLSKQSLFNNALQEQQRKAKERGFDLYQAETTARTASEKGIATASQDSVEELNGRMTAVQGHTFAISEHTRLLAENSSAILRSVMGIERNTSELPTRLASVETSVRSVKTTLEDIATRGIKIK